MWGGGKMLVSLVGGKLQKGDSGILKINFVKFIVYWSLATEQQLMLRYFVLGICEEN